MSRLVYSNGLWSLTYPVDQQQKHSGLYNAKGKLRGKASKDSISKRDLRGTDNEGMVLRT